MPDRRGKAENLIKVKGLFDGDRIEAGPDIGHKKAETIAVSGTSPYKSTVRNVHKTTAIILTKDQTYGRRDTPEKLARKFNTTKKQMKSDCVLISTLGQRLTGWKIGRAGKHGCLIFSTGN